MLHDEERLVADAGEFELGAEDLHPEEFDLEAVPQVLSEKDFRSSRRLCLQLALIFVWFVATGITDQLIATLIPAYKEHFGTNDAGVLVLFVAEMVGYFVVGLAADPLHRAGGLGGVVMGLFVLILAACAVGASAPPHMWMLAAGYFLIGCGLSGADALCNAWLAELVDGHALLGIFHACYGVGGLVAPLVASAIHRREWGWQYSFVVPLGVFVTTLPVGAWAFWPELRQKYLREHGASLENVSLLSTLKNKQVWLLVGVTCFYFGASVGFALWLPSYVMRNKGRDFHVAARIASAYWIGLTLGRILLGFVTNKLELEFVPNLVYFSAASVMVAVFSMINGKHTTWLAAVAALTGCCIGPVLQTTFGAAPKILDPLLKVAGIGVASGLGAAGSAFFPWLLGVVNSMLPDMWTLPGCVCVFAACGAGCWVALARGKV